MEPLGNDPVEVHGEVQDRSNARAGWFRVGGPEIGSDPIGQSLEAVDQRTAQLRFNIGSLTFGIVFQVQLHLSPAHTIQRREYRTTMDSTWTHLAKLITEIRSFDFSRYPRSDEMKLRLPNPPVDDCGLLQ